MSPRIFTAVGLLTLLSFAAVRADNPGADDPGAPAPLLRMGGGAKPTDVCRLAFAPDAKTIAWAGSGPVCLYDAASGKLRRSLKITGRCLAFAPDGKTIAVGEGASVHVFDAATGEEVVAFKAHPDGVFAAAYAPDGKTIVTAGDDDRVVLWDPAAGKERSHIELRVKGISVLAFSRDGKYLTAGGEAGELTVWKMEDDFQDERRRLMGRDGGVGYVAFGPDGGSFLWTQGHTIRVSEVETWVELARFDDRDMDAACFALAPDGKTLATGGKSVRLWDLETGEKLLQLRDDKTESAAVAFAPDGKTLASAAPDGTVLVWDLASLPLARLEAWWRELGGRDPADAVHAVRAMKATPAESVVFLREHIRPAPPPDPRVSRLIADLDSDVFDVREKAQTQLAKHGATIGPELEKAYAGQPSPEVRWRLESLLGRIKDAPSEETAKVRAVQVLETIGTDDARQVVENLAKGVPESRVTREAKASLLRWNGRPSP